MPVLRSDRKAVTRGAEQGLDERALRKARAKANAKANAKNQAPAKARKGAASSTAPEPSSSAGTSNPPVRAQEQPTRGPNSVQGPSDSNGSSSNPPVRSSGPASSAGPSNPPVRAREETTTASATARGPSGSNGSSSNPPVRSSGFSISSGPLNLPVESVRASANAQGPSISSGPSNRPNSTPGASNSNGCASNPQVGTSQEASGSSASNPGPYDSTGPLNPPVRAPANASGTSTSSGPSNPPMRAALVPPNPIRIRMERVNGPATASGPSSSSGPLNPPMRAPGAVYSATFSSNAPVRARQGQVAAPAVVSGPSSSSGPLNPPVRARQQNSGVPATAPGPSNQPVSARQDPARLLFPSIAPRPSSHAGPSNPLVRAGQYPAGIPVLVPRPSSHAGPSNPQMRVFPSGAYISNAKKVRARQVVPNPHLDPNPLNPPIPLNEVLDEDLFFHNFKEPDVALLVANHVKGEIPPEEQLIKLSVKIGRTVKMITEWYKFKNSDTLLRGRKWREQYIKKKLFNNKVVTEEQFVEWARIAGVFPVEMKKKHQMMYPNQVAPPPPVYRPHPPPIPNLRSPSPADPLDSLPDNFLEWTHAQTLDFLATKVSEKILDIFINNRVNGAMLAHFKDDEEGRQYFEFLNNGRTTQAKPKLCYQEFLQIGIDAQKFGDREGRLNDVIDAVAGGTNQLPQEEVENPLKRKIKEEIDDDLVMIYASPIYAPQDRPQPPPKKRREPVPEQNFGPIGAPSGPSTSVPPAPPAPMTHEASYSPEHGQSSSGPVNGPIGNRAILFPPNGSIVLTKPTLYQSMRTNGSSNRPAQPASVQMARNIPAHVPNSLAPTLTNPSAQPTSTLQNRNVDYRIPGYGSSSQPIQNGQNGNGQNSFNHQVQGAHVPTPQAPQVAQEPLIQPVSIQSIQSRTRLGHGPSSQPSQNGIGHVLNQSSSSSHPVQGAHVPVNQTEVVQKAMIQPASIQSIRNRTRPEHGPSSQPSQNGIGHVSNQPSSSSHPVQGAHVPVNQAPQVAHKAMIQPVSIQSIQSRTRPGYGSSSQQIQNGIGHVLNQSSSSSHPVQGAHVPVNQTEVVQKAMIQPASIQSIRNRTRPEHGPSSQPSQNGQSSSSHPVQGAHVPVNQTKVVQKAMIQNRTRPGYGSSSQPDQNGQIENGQNSSNQPVQAAHVPSPQAPQVAREPSQNGHYENGQNSSNHQVEAAHVPSPQAEGAQNVEEDRVDEMPIQEQSGPLLRIEDDEEMTDIEIDESETDISEEPGERRSVEANEDARAPEEREKAPEAKERENKEERVNEHASEERENAPESEKLDTDINDGANDDVPEERENEGERVDAPEAEKLDAGINEEANDDTPEAEDREKSPETEKLDNGIQKPRQEEVASEPKGQGNDMEDLEEEEEEEEEVDYDYNSWTLEEVGNWLLQILLQPAVDLILKEEIDGSVLDKFLEETDEYYDTIINRDPNGEQIFSYNEFVTVREEMKNLKRNRETHLNSKE